MAEPVLDFGVVTREVRSLVARRRELLLFLGSLFAGMGIYLQNILEGKLPKSLTRLESNAFLTYSLALTIPTIIIALRLAKLHAGMIINGVFYAKLLSAKLRPQLDPAKASRLNFAGVSVQFFTLTALIASLGAALWTLSMGRAPTAAAIVGGGLFVLLWTAFFYFHSQARRFARTHIRIARVEEVGAEELENHLAESLRDANHDMINIISFVGLILFSVFQALSGLGGINPKETEFSKAVIERQGPLILTLLLLTTCLLSTIVYLRLLRSLGNFSLELDPTDRPFRVFKLTDSFLGYCILAFFLTVSAHLFVFPILEGVRESNEFLWWFDGMVAFSALAGYGLTMSLAARDSKPKKSAAAAQSTGNK